MTRLNSHFKKTSASKHTGLSPSIVRSFETFALPAARGLGKAAPPPYVSPHPYMLKPACSPLFLPLSWECGRGTFESMHSRKPQWNMACGHACGQPRRHGKGVFSSSSLKPSLAPPDKCVLFNLGASRCFLASGLVLVTSSARLAYHVFLYQERPPLCPAPPGFPVCPPDWCALLPWGLNTVSIYSYCVDELGALCTQPHFLHSALCAFRGHLLSNFCAVTLFDG